MEWECTLKHARISARKARLVADLVRGMPVSNALSLLQFTPKKGGGHDPEGCPVSAGKRHAVERR